MKEKKMSVVIGENIAYRRKLLGMTQEQVAEKLEIGQDALSRMENGAISPKTARLRDFAKALECSVPELFRESDESMQEIATSIADMLKGLNQEKRTAVLEVLAHITRVMRGQ